MAAFDDLRVNAEVGVTVKLSQLLDWVCIAFGRFRIDLRGGAAGNTSCHPQHRAAHLDFLPDPVPFRPRRSAAEPDIGAKPAAVSACADLGL